MNGTFECTVIDHVLAEVGKNATPSIKFKLQPVKNVVTGEAVPSASPVWFDGWLTESAIERTLKTMSDCFFWAGNDISDFNGTGKFNGETVWAACQEETYQEKTQTKVAFMNPVGGGGNAVAPMDTAKQAGLAERLKGRILKYRQDNPAPVKPEAAEPAASSEIKDDENLPF